jgi:hypothetical protein
MFKLWFANLPERIISGEMTEVLKTVYETSKDYLTFVQEIPDAHRFALKFLCGFLKDIAKAEAITKMGLSNLSILFSPSIVSVPPMADLAAITEQTAIAHEFLSALLKNWDTSDIYPLPQGLLKQ